ncbi:MAG: S8 family serine peptidase [Acidobacteriota bacterium]
MKRAAAVLVVGLWALGVGAGSPGGAWPSEKVDPAVLREAEAGSAEFLVLMKEQADLSAARTLRTKEEKGRFVVERLRETAERSQGPLLAELAGLGAEVRPFWIANMVWVRGGLDALSAAASRAEVDRIVPNPHVGARLPEEEAAGREPLAVEWGVSRVNAPYAWGLGYTGRGVVVAGQDTGYQWNHPALRPHYRGWNGTTADHDFNWHDAIHSGGGSCGADSLVPCDDHGHGTHTMGTMVGDDGGSNQIGVAPGAVWIGCRNMDRGNGTPATYTECFQWFLAPTDLDGENADPSLAPDVINNSWGCPYSEGCTYPDILKAVVESARAAGIVVVASAGNSGSSCGSVADPPAIYDAAFSVGNTTGTDAIATSSSRGPVTVDGSNRLKPDVTAPGTSVRSSYPTSTYATLSGTSMAGPHVAGVVALLLSARPDLKGDVDAVEFLLASTADPKTSTQTCGGVPGSSIPNNTFGHGIVDAQRLFTLDSDGDGSGNLADCAPADGSAYSAPSEARNLTLSWAGTTVLSWQAPSAPGGTEVVYDLLRSADPADFSAAVCVASGTAALTASDGDAPSGVAYYLVRSRNACGASLGTRSDGAPRSAPSCP